MIIVRPYLYRKQFEASEIINDHAHGYSKNIKDTIREVQSMGCEWCGKSFRNSVDCLESIRDEVFDCDQTMDHIVESAGMNLMNNASIATVRNAEYNSANI